MSSPQNSAECQLSNSLDSITDQHDSACSTVVGTASFAKSPVGVEDRRILLLVYIHGFLGEDTSFQSFPAHVHSLLSARVSDTHLVRTKIYPRYKSRRSIRYARDEFSRWLQPHENSGTDIVLLGHSMGGLLAADVILLPSIAGSDHPFKHRVLGTLNFDTPFLGMHPGIIRSAIASLFRTSPTTSQEPRDLSLEAMSSFEIRGSSTHLSPTTSSNTSATFSSITLSPSTTDYTTASTLASSICSHITDISHDPNYDPFFSNDIRLVTRKGTMQKLRYFTTKHRGALGTATRNYLLSHLEFGCCLVDFKGLKKRYMPLRALEDEKCSGVREGQRVRFANFFTASTGRRKKHTTTENCGLTPVRIQSTDLERCEYTEKEKKQERLFCLQPKRTAVQFNLLDSSLSPQETCWIKVFIQDADEVDAHCGLFLPGLHYEALVGVVTGKLEEWIRVLDSSE